MTKRAQYDAARLYGRYPTLSVWLDGQLDLAVDVTARRMIQRDATLSPIRARELAAAEEFANYSREVVTLEEHAGTGNADEDALYERVIAALEAESFAAALVRLTGTRTLLVDVDVIRKQDDIDA